MEHYHAKVTSTFKGNHPNIWNFYGTLNDIITDTDIDIARLNNGLDISRSQKREKILKDQQMESCKQKLANGTYTPNEYIVLYNLNQYIIQITRMWPRILRTHKMIFQWEMFQ